MEVEQTTAAAREQRTVRRRSQQSGRAAAPGPLVGSVEWIAASGAGNRAVAALLHPTRVTGEPAAGEGRPLDQAVRAEMEAHLGADFSRVRVHTGPAAEAAASALDARAYTVGQDIVFGPGEYRPSEPVGRAVLAHELTHAAQQARGGTTAAGSPGAERAARAGAASLTAGQRPAPVAVGAAVGVARQGKTEEVPGQAPAEERFGTLGEAALDLATAPLGSGLAQRAMKAAVRGFVGQLRREAASGEAAARIQADLAELRKPGNLGPMLGGAAAGLALGLVSPVTDLFSLAALVERLPELGSRLGYWLGAKAKWLADEATSLGHEVSGFAGQLWAAVKKLKEDRTAVFELLESKGTELSARLEAAAGQSGREAAAKIVGFFTGKKEGPEKKEEEKPAESVWHVLTTTVEGETSGVASFLASKAGRLVDTGFTGRWSRFGRDLGKALGVVVSNLLILALTDGAGNAIIAIADKLGRLGGLAAGGARALAGFGQAVRVVEGAIAAVIAGGIKLAKPLEAVAGPLGRLLERFRLFLRRLLGVVEHEGAAAAAGAGKAAGGLADEAAGRSPGAEPAPTPAAPAPAALAAPAPAPAVPQLKGVRRPPTSELTKAQQRGLAKRPVGEREVTPLRPAERPVEAVEPAPAPAPAEQEVPVAEEIPEALPEAVPAEQVELATGTYDGPSGPSGPSPTVASAKPPGGKPPLRVVQGGRNPPADLPAAGPRTAAPPARPPRAPKKAVARTPEDEYQDFLAMLREEGATGEVVAAGERLSLAPYAKAAEARAEIGAPPGTQGLHLFPDAVGKHIPGFKKDAALVLLEPRAINTEMDAGWKLAFQRMQAEGRATATAWEVHNAVSESIGAAAHLSPGVKASLQLRLQDEMFIELGLDPAQELILPYANFYKPKP